MSDLPELKGEIIGFRYWGLLDGYKLYSANTPLGWWELGINKAVCKLGYFTGTPFPPTHEAPRHDCQCGYYAYNDPRMFAAAICAGQKAGGAIKAWGRIEVHDTGFRAEYVEPILLTSRDEMRRRVQAIASEWEIPYVEFNMLAQEALKYGTPVPPQCRPLVEYQQLVSPRFPSIRSVFYSKPTPAPRSETS